MAITPIVTVAGAKLAKFAIILLIQFDPAKRKTEVTKNGSEPMIKTHLLPQRLPRYLSLLKLTAGQIVKLKIPPIVVIIKAIVVLLAFNPLRCNGIKPPTAAPTKFIQKNPNMIKPHTEITPASEYRSEPHS